MAPRILGVVLVAICAGTTLPGPQVTAAERAARGDLREFRVGMTVAELPEGYVNFTCAVDRGRQLEGWGAYRSCPAGARGLHEVRFDYGPSKVAFAEANDKWEGTKVAGHPVVVSLLLSGAGVVEGIRFATDPEARRYLRKKAYLLSLQVKHRFSPTTWTCVRHEASGGEKPVGGVFIKERCENRLEGRTVRLETDLYRRPDQGPEDFVNATRVEIMAVSGS